MHECMYNSVRRRYELQLGEEIKEKIENEELTEEDAGWYFQEKMEEWQWGYSDAMYDFMNDR